MTAWDLTPGDVTTRQRVSGRFGGAIQGGILPSIRSPNVMIYTDPSRGAQHGYDFDGWSRDDPEVFYYTGAGQVGDQELKRGNKAIAEHRQTGRVLRVFETLPGSSKSTEGAQRYIGEFAVDSTEPYRWEMGRSANNGPQRKLIVFKLRALDQHSARAMSKAAETVTPVPTLVAAEVNEVDEFDRATPTDAPARRREANIMRQLEAWLTGQGCKVSRWRIPIPETTAAMLTDTYDATDEVLWEVKAAPSRESVRMAIGQLADYLHHLRRLKPGMSSGIVLPSAPHPDLVELVHEAGHRLLIPNGSDFTEITVRS